MYSEEIENQVEEHTITSELEKLRESNRQGHEKFQIWLNDLDRTSIAHNKRLYKIEEYIAEETERKRKIRENIKKALWFTLILFVFVTSVAGFGYLTGMLK